MRVLLAYPEMPDTFWAMQHALKIFGKKAMYPPLGLLTVAAMLPDDWELRLVDLNVRPLTDDDLAWADYTFVSAMTVQDQSVRQIIAASKAAGVPVVAGGPLFTHEHHLFPEVDHFILNEAEITLPPFLEDLAAGHPKRLYESTLFADVSETPTPRWDLIDEADYQYAIIQYSRGCPYMCDFCDVTALFGRRPRVKTPEAIIAELEALGDLQKSRFVLFADDNLIGNKKKLKTELLPALIQWRKEKKPAMYFATQVTVNLVDDEEMMQLMLEAGFGYIFIGIETPDETSLLASLKRQNLKRDLLGNIRHLHSQGFIVVGGFIVGFDTDEPTIFQRQIDFIQQSGITLPTVNILKAPPGTELYDRMQAEGRLLERFVFDEYKTNLVPKMDPAVLEKGFGDVLRAVYTPAGMYERIRQFLTDYEPPAVELHVPPPHPRDYLGTLLRSLWHLGIQGPERRYFWRLLGWTLRHKPQVLDLAFTHLIMMHQLRKLYEGYEAAQAPPTSRAAVPEPARLAA